MRLTNQTQYAVRMLMFCAQKQDRLATTREIARFFDLPEKFMLKVLHALGKTGLIETVRGRGGGFRLAKPADEIRLGEVIRMVESDFELAECFSEGGADCPLIATCGLNEALSNALKAFFDTLNGYTISDLVTKQHNIGVLLQLQEAQKLPFEASNRNHH